MTGTTGTADRAPKRAPARERPGPFAAFTAALATFLLALALLADQVRSGRDPAIGPAARELEPAADRAPVVVRRIVERRVVVRRGTQSAPAPAPDPAPAPAPQPAAPPEPAPVVSRAS